MDEALAAAEAPETEAERVGELVREGMAGVVELTVPLVVEIGEGRS